MTEHDIEQTHADWLAESRRRAQASAMIWAERAEEAYELARRFEDRAQSWTPKPAHAEIIDSERAQSREQAALYVDARQLAEMWARVATVLVPPPAPLELASFGPEPEPIDG
ncbi:hypothetical protein ACIOK4_00225 [Streptomyces bottropensis]|uniref:hypothetical protein n=1 Tax=Streptomyces bottropensis TaxID=42235 RepID=UPI0038061EA8